MMNYWKPIWEQNLWEREIKKVDGGGKRILIIIIKLINIHLFLSLLFIPFCSHFQSEALIKI
jgi:hypothetical protein